MSNSAIPNIGQPKGQFPEFESLRNNSALDGRRKANAVFVVLGMSCPDLGGLWLMGSEKFRFMAIPRIDEADGRPI